MPTTHPVHTADPPYAPPVIHPSSPTNSIGTEYGPDETSHSDNELGAEEFYRKVEEQVGIGKERQTELEANRSVLLPKPTNSAEEKLLHEQVLRSLRAQVAALEQEELFEGIMQKTSQGAFEQRASSSSIDDIMHSMLGPPINASGSNPMTTKRLVYQSDHDVDDIMLGIRDG